MEIDRRTRVAAEYCVEEVPAVFGSPDASPLIRRIEIKPSVLVLIKKPRDVLGASASVYFNQDFFPCMVALQ